MSNAQDLVDRRCSRECLAESVDLHRLHAFGSNYTLIPPLGGLTVENVIAALRRGPLRVTNPPCSFIDLMSTIYFVFVAHPLRLRKRLESHSKRAQNEAA